MEMMDMKMPKKTDKEIKAGLMPSPMERDQYPYGLRVRLGEDEIAKLGDDLYDNAEVGEDATITAKGTVVSKSADDRQGGKKSRSMEIQMKQMHVACKGKHDKGTMDDFVKARSAKKY